MNKTSKQMKPDPNLPLAVPVYVQCGGERFLAYRDQTNVWRAFPSGQILRGQVHRVPYQEPFQ
ncbi:MAG TPA: hypothetical protein VEH04_06725 [Verrucomicrobiae bacterium]|nr:hypothetical protein [Verrucomicrobiae bacterium]